MAVYLFIYFFLSPSAKPRPRGDGRWNDNKWEPLEELLAIKGNTEPQYTTPVSRAKLKQIASTSIAYYAANYDDIFIIIILIRLFDHCRPFPRLLLHYFLFENTQRRFAGRQGQSEVIAKVAVTTVYSGIDRPHQMSSFIRFGGVYIPGRMF